VGGVEILAFPLTWHIAYITACCYRTSRDNDWLPTSKLTTVYTGFGWVGGIKNFLK